MVEAVVSLLLAVVVRMPEPVVVPIDLKTNESPVRVSVSHTVTSSNGLYRIVTGSLIFENSNTRPMAATLEFPLPEGATVCGYRLEVNGEMVPGVVCEKEKARVAFENEQRKGADPGVVEQVKGNVWRTRIYPIPVRGTRKAEVSYIVSEESPSADRVVERCGDYIYCGEAVKTDAPNAFDVGSFSSGWVLWDASLSRKGRTDADLAVVQTFPETGDWTLVVFRDVPTAAQRFTSKAELIAALSAEPCDGGTDFGALLASVPEDGTRKCLFSDEQDTLSEVAPDLEGRTDFVFVSRPAPKPRKVTVARRAFDAQKDAGVAEGRLLATAWVANRIADLGTQATDRKEEFLALGREFGVASPVTSLIVLETLQQWIDHKIEPPKELSFHAEWVKARAAQDDQIAAKVTRADFEKRLLELWKERVEWWKNPKPKKITPKSGLFDRIASAVGMRRSASVASENGASVDASEPAPMAMSDAVEPQRNEPARKVSAMPRTDSKSAAATVTLAAWDPKTPYIDALKSAAKGEEYKTYLVQSDKFGNSPAFYLDCAGWFFKAGLIDLAKRIISNLAEFRLEDVALWRTMGWRLRESGAYDEAVRAFRHALRLRNEEGQAYRDLALVLAERGKDCGDSADISEAMKMLVAAVFTDHGRRSARRSNDMQVAIVALEELNGLIAWSDAHDWKGKAKPIVPQFDSAYRRNLPMDLRIIMSWDADETDIDIHVLEPDGEEAYYSHRRTSQGGFVGEDVTTGYGPEEYLRKEADKGVYKVLSNYFASHQQALTGAATVTATVYTNWSRSDERRQTLTLRLDKPKDKHLIGEVRID